MLSRPMGRASEAAVEKGKGGAVLVQGPETKKAMTLMNARQVLIEEFGHPSHGIYL